MAKKAVITGKALIKSKTFWFNVLSLLVAIASLFGFGQFEPNTQVTEAVAIINTIGNIFIRTRTREPITSLR